MAKVSDVLRELVRRVDVLEAEVEALKRAASEWDEEIDLDVVQEAQHQQAEATGDGTIKLAAPNAKQVALRKEWAPRMGLENLPKEHGLHTAEAIEAYRQGGPIWLYNFDRDFVLTLPKECRAAMVDDVIAGGGQREAIEMGRDLLKDDAESRRGAEIALAHQSDTDWQAKVHG